MADGIITPSMRHDHDIDFAKWLHPAMRHVALETWQWIHQVNCSVIRGSGMTYRWIRPVAAPCNVIVGVCYKCPLVSEQELKEMFNAIKQAVESRCLILGDFNYPNIDWDS